MSMYLDAYTAMENATTVFWWLFLFTLITYLVYKALRGDMHQ